MGSKKGAISEGGGGVASRIFFPRTPTKIDEQAISYFTVNRCFRANLLFSSLIWSAECFFGLYDSLGNTIVVVPPPWLPLIIN